MKDLQVNNIIHKMKVMISCGLNLQWSPYLMDGNITFTLCVICREGDYGDWLRPCGDGAQFTRRLLLVNWSSSWYVKVPNPATLVLF